MTRKTFEEHLAMGRKVEDAFARHLAFKGHHALRAFPEDTSIKRGPRIFAEPGDIVSPDIVSIAPDGKAFWFELKGKSVPGYRYFGEHKGWEHGVDMHLFEQYGKLCDRADVWLVVCEHLTPKSLDVLPRPPLVEGKSDWNDYKKHLVEGPVWRAIKYAKCLKVGRRQENWPRQASCGEKNKVGWLWPVAEMETIEVLEGVENG